MNAIVVSAIMGILMMFTGAFVKSKSFPRYLAIGGSILLFLANALELKLGHPLFDISMYNMLKTSSYSLGFLAVMIGSLVLFFMLSGKDIERVGNDVGEYFALIFFVMCGVAICATFNTLLFLFLGIEILSIPLYILTGSSKRNLLSIEASLKYFLMGSFSTGLLLMGIAMVYGGTPNASFYISGIDFGNASTSAFIVIGMVLMLVAISFKVSAAPFHFWAPDVYDGAPTVFTSFMSTIVKVAGFLAFIRLFENSFGVIHKDWQKLIVVITIATLFIGNITAIFQQSVKRMLAYSSIAQAGFMMLALFALNDRAKEGMVLYAAAYSIAAIGLFGIVARMNEFTISDFNGLGKTHPVVAFTATIFLLSLTGIPLTAGFQSKLYMLTAVVENSNQVWLVIIAIIFSAISAYYYFRVIQAMYFKEPSMDEPVELWNINGWFRFVLILLSALTIIIGIYPEWILGWLYYW